MSGLLLCGLIIGFLGGIIALIMFLQQKRTAELQSIAEQLQLQFFPKGDDSIAPLLSNLEFFTYATHCNISNLIKGQISRNGKPVTVAIFDYQYTIGTNASYTTVGFDENAVSVESTSDVDSFSQTVVVFYDESIDIPGFNLRPELLLEKLANFVGIEDINFCDFPVFSRRYRLDAIKNHDVRDLFQPNLIKFYERHKIRTEAHGSSVVILPFENRGHSQRTRREGNIVLTESDLILPTEVKSYLDLGLQLINLLEKNLVKQHAFVLSSHDR